MKYKFFPLFLLTSIKFFHSMNIVYFNVDDLNNSPYCYLS